VTPEQVDAVCRRCRAIERVAALGIGQARPASCIRARSRRRTRNSIASTRARDQESPARDRAKFFEALAGFQGEMRPDAPPQTALRAIGQTAVSVLDVTSAAAFSLIPGQNFAEVLLFDEHGEVFEKHAGRLPASAARRQVGEGPVLADGRGMDGLLRPISPRAGARERYWICLEADGAASAAGLGWQCPGESQRLGAGWSRKSTAIASGWGLALRTAQIHAKGGPHARRAVGRVNRKLPIRAGGDSAQPHDDHRRRDGRGAAHEMNNPLAVISGPITVAGPVHNYRNRSTRPPRTSIHEQSAPA
jgi:hypothetical protein